MNGEQKAMFIQSLYAAGRLGAQRLVELSGTNLQKVALQGAHLNGNNLTEANLQKANLTGTILDHANLNGNNLAGARLTDTILDHTNPSHRRHPHQDTSDRGQSARSRSHSVSGTHPRTTP